MKKCENHVVKGFVNNLISVYIILTFGMTMLKSIGCIDFKSAYMDDKFLAYALFLLSIVLEEYQWLKRRTKDVLLGVLFGMILFLGDSNMYMFFAIFLMNVVWESAVKENDCKYGFKRVARVFFFCMLTLELYSVFGVFNEYMFEYKVNSSHFLKYIDFVFLFSLVLIILYDKRRKKNRRCENFLWVKRFKLSIKIMVVIIAFVTFIFTQHDYQVKENLFFVGKSFEQGYLICESDEICLNYYIQKNPNLKMQGDGTSLNNLGIYEMIPITEGFPYQMIIVQIMRAVCIFQYSLFTVYVWMIFTLILLVVKFCSGKGIGLTLLIERKS